MCIKFSNSQNFVNDLTAQNTSTGQKGLKIGSGSLINKLLPLTNYLINHLWKDRDSDPQKITTAKKVARSLTYLFTILTAAPLYQFIFHALPKEVSISSDHTDYAKKILTSLERYNQLRHEILKAGDHARDYLAPNNIEQRASEMNAGGEIRIALSPEEHVRVKENIHRLQREKTENYNVVLQTQIEEVTTYIKSLPPQDRKKAYQEIIGALMTHVGFEEVFVRKNERLDFTLEVSNRLGANFIKKSTQELLAKIAFDSNFVNLNTSIKSLVDEVSHLFGISEDAATTLVSYALKETILDNYISIESFENYFSPHLDDVSRTDTTEFRTHIDCLQNGYNATIEELENAYQDLINGAILQETDEALSLLNKDILDLRKQIRTISDSLKEINEKLHVLASKGSRYHLRKITETTSQLHTQKRHLEATYQMIVAALQQNLKKLANINHQKNINFETPHIQAIKAKASDLMEVERQVREAHANLGPKNVRAFRAFLHVVKGVDLNAPAEKQIAQVHSRAEHLHDESRSFATRWESVCKFFGFTPKHIDISLYDVLQEHLNTFPADSLQARRAVGTVYAKMSPAQKAYFAQKIAEHLGVLPVFFNNELGTDIGKSYLKSYIEGKNSSGNREVSPEIIKQVALSLEGKAAATYKPYTRLNDYWWTERA